MFEYFFSIPHIPSESEQKALNFNNLLFENPHQAKELIQQDPRIAYFFLLL